MRIIELIWRVTQQLIISRDNKMNEIIGFASGFFTCYKEKLFFVTADHALHSHDYDQGDRTWKENKLFIANNSQVAGTLQSVYTPLGNFTYFDRFDFKELFQGNDVELEVLAIPDMQDVALCLREHKFDAPLLTHELLDYDGSIIVGGKLPKFIIPEAAYGDPDKDSFYIVTGTTHNKIVDGIRIERTNAIYQDMKFDRIDDECYILKHPGRVIVADWEGLSGCPVMDEKGRVIGMLIRAVEDFDEVRVFPMSRIKKLMDYVIQTEVIQTK